MNDHETRQLVAPVCLTIAAMGFSAFLIYDAAQIEDGIADHERYTSVRTEFVAKGIRSLAEILGWAGSWIASAVVVGAMIAWIVVTVRRIRAARGPVQMR